MYILMKNAANAFLISCKIIVDCDEDKQSTKKIVRWNAWIFIVQKWKFGHNLMIQKLKYCKYWGFFTLSENSMQAMLN